VPPSFTAAYIDHIHGPEDSGDARAER
jgi:hypothetical protein